MFFRTFLPPSPWTCRLVPLPRHLCVSSQRSRQSASRSPRAESESCTRPWWFPHRSLGPPCPVSSRFCKGHWLLFQLSIPVSLPQWCHHPSPPYLIANPVSLSPSLSPHPAFYSLSSALPTSHTARPALRPDQAFRKGCSYNHTPDSVCAPRWALVQRHCLT